MATKSVRAIMFSDISTLTNLLNLAEFNCKAVLKHTSRPFRNHKKFDLPDTTFEQSKRFVLNNLFDLKNLLNQIDIGEKQTEDTASDEAL